MEIELIFEGISIGFVLLGILLLLLGAWKSKYCNNAPQRQESSHHFAILIPARDESKVIKGILESIQKQTRKISFEDVYVIVEKESDPTVSIASSYNATVVVRKELDKRRKGYALNEGIQWIRDHQKKYDAYFIFDADNVLEETYLEEMEKTFDQGYDIGIGYRNCKNGNDSWVTACSALTFSMINTLGNEAKKKKTGTVTISGTGFYIRGTWIEKWQGYPFHTLTEDYELTLYATLHGLTTDYNKKAKFYDEQPIKYQNTVPQRTRWVRGYFDSRRIYLPQLKEALKKKDKNYGSQFATYLGVKPYISIVIGVILFLVIQVIKLCSFPTRTTAVIIVMTLLSIYLVLLSITFVMIKKEQGKLNLTRKMQAKALFMNPFFLATYVPCAIMALLNRNLEWTKIEHQQMMK